METHIEAYSFSIGFGEENDYPHFTEQSLKWNRITRSLMTMNFFYFVKDFEGYQISEFK